MKIPYPKSMGNAEINLLIIPLYLDEILIPLKSYILKSFSLITLFLIVSCAPALKKKFRAIETKNHGFSGLVVYEPETDKILFEHNAHKYFTPASNIKILTLYTGLQLLEDSIVALNYTQRNDSLIFTSTGDPTFLNPKFSTADKALQFLQDSDKKLFYQSPNWEEKKYGAGWAWDDFEYSFSAQKSAFPVYGNLLHITRQEGQTDLDIIPELFKDSISGSNKILISKNSNASLNKTFPFNTSEEISLKILEAELEKSIGIISTNFMLNKKVYSVKSDSLYKIMMHQSDNFLAEQLLIMSSVKITDTLKTDAAINFIKSEKFSMFEDKTYWVDGSGLSRYNLITPNSLVATLNLIFKEKGKNYVKNIFPTAGQHGTLKDLLKNEGPFIYAKSGSLKNNYSLSGYLETKKGRFLIFSFMNSNFTTDSKQLKNKLEEFLLEIRNKY
ncbi:D-alanyl-D-alanine carboxypeptidase [Christiangramia aquimixticola]|uniref:D-alanyl-D-alanine carboxypeptidase n=1 Tax=Christiangramia aquimixticola TaxID=1697558 RepID=UPI003AA8367B